MDVVLPLFLLISAALIGGILAKAVKLHPLLGYIAGGLVFSTILPPGVKNVAKLSEVGTILLLFSIGLELSFSRLSKFFRIAFFGAIIQVLAVSAISFMILSAIGIDPVSALILAAGFSLSSTALVVKILGDRGELETLHGGIMIGWLLVQDLAVVPLMVVIPLLGSTEGIVGELGSSLIKALFVVGTSIYLGKSVVPQIIHRIALTNSRELLVLSSVALALGVATLTSLFGISTALGAFLAGVVISETQEHHAVFAEVRPLRDLFVALFFVSLGFLISPMVFVSKFGLIIGLSLGILALKTLVIFLISVIFGVRGRSAVATSLGLSQVGEFAFVIFSTSLALGKLSPDSATLGIAVTLVTLFLAPFLIRVSTPLWRRLKGVSPLFSSGQRSYLLEDAHKGHIIICGYGRVGSWVGKALGEFKIPFVVVEYNEEVAAKARSEGIEVVYGDPAETGIMETVGIKNAKALVLAIPDTIAQENLIAYAKTVNPDLKIISRVHEGGDLEKLRTLGVDKLVQPEFEAGIAIVRGILSSMGKDKVQIADIVKKIRISHAKS